MKIKIFGERNTATNAVCRIIENNSTSILHPGTMRELDQLAEFRTGIMRKLGLKPSTIEACIDHVFSGKSSTEQWKHAATNFDNANDFIDTHVIFTIRHPLSWLLSFFRNPYHALIQPPDTFEEFLGCEWKTLGRDRLDGKSFRPAALYEEKCRSYLHLADELDRVNVSYTFLKFEEVVTDQIGCFERLAPYLDQPAGKFNPVTESTKEKVKNLDFYKEYYGNQHWRSEVSEEAADRFSFDSSLMNQFGYD